MKKAILTLFLSLLSMALAVDLNILRSDLAALLPSERAGVAVAYVGPETENELFVGNPAFDSTTLFEYGSITKVFTAIVLAQLADEGVVSLEASLNDYLPEDVRADKWQGVTLRSLATHTAGLPRVPQNTNGLYWLVHGDNAYARYSEAKLFSAVEGVRLEPSGKYNHYSNFGFGLLGTLLAHQTDTPYEELIGTHLFEPLGMSRVTTQGWASDNIASPLWNNGTDAGYWDFDALAGAGAARGSLTDAKKFLKASMRACSETGALARANCEAQQPNPVKAGQYMTQGLGWVRSESPAGDIVWHNGGTGGFSTFLGFNIKTGEGLVVLANVYELEEVTSLSLEALSAQP